VGVRPSAGRAGEGYGAAARWGRRCPL